MLLTRWPSKFAQAGLAKKKETMTEEEPHDGIEFVDDDQSTTARSCIIGIIIEKRL